MPLDEALRGDMSDPTMCGDAAIAAANGGEMADLIERLRAFEGSDELGNGDFSPLSEAAATLEALRAEVDALARENEAMRRCAIKYLGWLGVTHKPLDAALREDMANPDMCGDAALNPTAAQENDDA